MLAGFSFFFGSYDPFWETLGLKDDLRIPLTIGISVLILLIGHFITILQIERNINKNVSELKTHLSQLPNLNSLLILPNGDEGIKYLTSRLSDARFVRNTRIPVGKSVNYKTEFSQKYLEETKKLLKKKDVIFKDIILKTNKKLAEELISISNENNSTYQYKEISKQNNGFLNFLILEDKSNVSEVVFGWPTSETQGYKENCFISRDKNIISLFSTIFEELWNEK